ncbi:hypothetical protein AHAS_Ahas16G0167800 [Arachis hypogaea]
MVDQNSDCRVPPAAVNELEWSAGSCSSSSPGPSHECSPIAKSVVSTVFGMQSDLRRLLDAISRHDAVVSGIKDASSFSCGGGLCRRMWCQLEGNARVVDAIDTTPVARQRSDLPSREPAAVVNIGKLVSMTIEGIPKSMNLVFRPTDEMNLSEVELVVAIYIFMRHLPESMQSLRAVLNSIVLNTVVRMLTLASIGHAWFLPSTIMQAAVGGRSLTSANMTSIRNNYMCSKVDQVTRVYQAMWCDQHWYLMIIDVAQQKLIYLDSLRDPREADAKKMAMLHVALYLEGMTLGKSWLSGDRVMRPRFSAFEFEEPNVPQQAADFMDCGIWIAQWMIRAYMWQDYEVQHVNAATWMRLAVDLFMKSHNQLAQDFVSKAFAHWQTKTV